MKWGYVYFEEKGAASARDWLESIDAGVRRELLRTVDSVVLFSNPPGYPASYAQMTRQCSAVSFPPSLPPIP